MRHYLKKFGDLQESTSGDYKVIRTLLIASILLLAAWLFWRQLLEVPPGLEMDELIEAQIAEQILDGDWRLFYEAGQGREPLYHFWLAGLMAVLGRNLITLRLASTLISLLALAATYRFVRDLMGNAVAALSSLLGVTTFWVLFAARSGLRSTSLPLLASLAGLFLWRGLRREDKRHATGFLILAGALTGLAFYTYTAARALPFIFLVFILYLALFHRQIVRERRAGLLLGSAAAVLLLTPLLLFLRANPGADEFAFLEFNRPVAELQRGNPLPAVETTRQTLGMFTFRGDPLIFDNIPDKPIYNGAVGLLFYMGLFFSLWRWRRPAYALLLIWLGIGLLPGMVSQPAPNFYRTVLAQVVVPVFPSLALVWIASWMGQRVGRRRLVYGVAVFFTIILVTGQLARTWRDYYLLWPGVEGVHFFWQESLADAARYIDSDPEVKRAAICTVLIGEEDSWWRPAWQSIPYLLSRQDVSTGFYDCRQSLLLLEKPAHYIFPDDIPSSELPSPFADIIAKSHPLPAALPESSGEVLISQGQADDHLLPLDEVWWAPEVGGEQTALPVNFGDTLALRGYDYLIDRHAPGGQVQLLTEWELLARPSTPLSLFTHVMPDPMTVVAQQDGMPVSTRSLRSGDRFWVLHDQIWLPEDSSAEQYLVSVGLYDPETMVRLQLAGNGESRSDRLFLRPIEIE